MEDGIKNKDLIIIVHAVVLQCCTFEQEVKLSNWKYYALISLQSVLQQRTSCCWVIKESDSTEMSTRVSFRIETFYMYVSLRHVLCKKPIVPQGSENHYWGYVGNTWVGFKQFKVRFKRFKERFKMFVFVAICYFLPNFKGFQRDTGCKYWQINAVV